MLKRRTFLTTSTAAAGLLALPMRAYSQDAPLKIGFVYQAPRDDNGWTERHEEARLQVEEHFGDRVSTTFVENIQEGPDAERVIRQLAQTGHEIIFTTSFSFMNPTVRVARQFPKIKFEHCAGYQRADNVATYAARYYEGRHVMGLLSGMTTKTNTIGYIASFPIPGVLRGINAAFLAARKVNPEVEMKVVWINTWFDPGREADAATALIQQGADVLMQHVNSPASIRVAQENGVKAFGLAVDMSEFGPDAHLSSLMFDWAPYYIERVQAVIDGTWTSKDTWSGVGPGMVTFAPFNESIPKATMALVDTEINALRTGAFHPFQGPIRKQDGTLWLDDGELPTDGDLFGMDFYVEGIGGSLPT